MLELGIKAPDFELPDQNGEVHKLSDYLGKKIINPSGLYSSVSLIKASTADQNICI